MRFALLIAAALTLAACGGTSKSTTSSTPSRPATSTTSSSTTASTPTSTGATATTAPAQPQCRAAGLALAFLGQQGATGHGELGFSLRNTGTSSCRTFGYPGIQFLDRAGGALPTIPAHTTRDFFGQVPALALTVAPGASISFRLGVTHGAASPVGCTTAYGLQVIPPNDTATLRVSIPTGAYECRTATVSPVARDGTAFP